MLSQLSKLQVTTSYFDENMGKVGVKSDTVFRGLVEKTNKPELWNCPSFRGLAYIFEVGKQQTF